MRRLSLAQCIAVAAALALCCPAVSFAQPGSSASASAARPTTTIATGPAARQRLDLFAPSPGRAAAAPPLVLYIHGGGWAMGSHQRVGSKAAWASGLGVWFGSIGYRYLPEAAVEVQAADIGAAIRAARSAAATHGYDPDRIILMGHSAGAHLAALVATDPRFAGDGFAAIRAVIAIDGAGYDVPRQMAANRAVTRRLYANAFGDDPARQRALSPITHVGGPDAPDWLFIHVAHRADAAAQNQAMAAALRDSGRAAAVVAIPGTHMTANRDFGTPAYPAAAAVDALVRRVMARP